MDSRDKLRILESRDTFRYRVGRSVAPLHVKLNNFFYSRADKQSVKLQFLKDNNITKRAARTHDATKKEYIIRTQHIEHLARIRDRQVLRELLRARHVIAKLHGFKQKVEILLAEEEAYLKALKLDYVGVQKRLTGKDLTPLQKAYLQGDAGTLDASIENQTSAVMRVKNILVDVNRQTEDIHKLFTSFTSDVRSSYDILLNQYTKVAGRKLNAFGFTLYNSKMRDFDDETTSKVKEFLGGK